MLADPAHPRREALGQDQLGQQLVGVGLGSARRARPRSADRSGAGSRHDRCGRAAAARAPRRSSAGRSAPVRCGRAGGSPATSSSRRRCWRSACSRGRRRRPCGRVTGPGGAAVPSRSVVVFVGVVLTRACCTIEGRWTVRMYVGQSMARGSKPNVALVVGERRSHMRHQVVDLVDRLALRVQAVQLDVLERPLDLDPLGLQPGRRTRPACRATAAPGAPARRV